MKNENINIATGQILWILFGAAVIVDEKFLILWILAFLLFSKQEIL